MIKSYMTAKRQVKEITEVADSVTGTVIKSVLSALVFVVLTKLLMHAFSITGTGMWVASGVEQVLNLILYPFNTTVATIVTQKGYKEEEVMTAFLAIGLIASLLFEVVTIASLYHFISDVREWVMKEGGTFGSALGSFIIFVILATVQVYSFSEAIKAQVVRYKTNTSVDMREIKSNLRQIDAKEAELTALSNRIIAITKGTYKPTLADLTVKDGGGAAFKALKKSRDDAKAALVKAEAAYKVYKDGKKSQIVNYILKDKRNGLNQFTKNKFREKFLLDVKPAKDKYNAIEANYLRVKEKEVKILTVDQYMKKLKAQERVLLNDKAAMMAISKRNEVERKMDEDVVASKLHTSYFILLGLILLVGQATIESKFAKHLGKIALSWDNHVGVYSQAKKVKPVKSKTGAVVLDEIPAEFPSATVDEGYANGNNVSEGSSKEWDDLRGRLASITLPDGVQLGRVQEAKEEPHPNSLDTRKKKEGIKDTEYYIPEDTGITDVDKCLAYIREEVRVKGNDVPEFNTLWKKVGLDRGEYFAYTFHTLYDLFSTSDKILN